MLTKVPHLEISQMHTENREGNDKLIGKSLRIGKT